MFKNKTHIFFDLDHTLWDYDRNCEEALQEIFTKFNLQNLGIMSDEKFIIKFHQINNKLWNLYDSRQITSDQLRFRRFREIFLEFAIKDLSLCDKIHESYMELSPNKPYLIQGAWEILNYLAPHYSLHIITNGIEDNQLKKMKASGIDHFFSTITCSQKAKARKPEKKIFEFALNSAQATVNQSIMIGDNYEVDIIGARNSGLDYLFFNPGNNFFAIEEKSMIKHLLELKQFL